MTLFKTRSILSVDYIHCSHDNICNIPPSLTDLLPLYTPRYTAHSLRVLKVLDLRFCSRLSPTERKNRTPISYTTYEYICMCRHVRTLSVYPLDYLYGVPSMCILCVLCVFMIICGSMEMSLLFQMIER